MEVSLHFSNAYAIPVDTCITAESLDGGAIRLLSTGQGSKVLIGCSEGTTVVSLRRNADNSVLDDVTIIVTSPPPPSTPTPTPAVRFSSHLYSVIEVAPLPQPIEVRLSRASGQNLDIPITVSGGTDTDSGDYSVDGLNSGKLRINSGDTSETFTIRANQDTDCNNETVNLGFGTPPSGVGLGSPSNATLTIEDDDPCPPTNLEIRYLETSTNSLVVSYTHGASTERFYQFELHRSLTAVGGYSPLPESKRVNVIVADAVFHDLDALHWYKARGRTCKTEQRTGCGNWSDESAAFLFDSPPTITSVAVDPDDADRLVVNYTGATAQTGHFRFQILRSPTQSGSYDEVYTVDDHIAYGGVEFDGLDHSRWYQFRAMSCRAGWDNCTHWSGYTDKVFLLAKPVLDVEPRPLRKANLSWDPVAVPSTHTAEYDLEIRELGGSWPTSPQTMSITTLEIDLDEVLPGKGLADGDYQFRVKARQKGKGGAADGMDGGYSDTITIIDNHLLTGGRAYGSSGGGRASLEWTTDASATSYQIRYRQLGHYNAFLSLPAYHTSLKWPKGTTWPYYHLAQTEDSNTLGNETIAGLNDGELYAFQVNYNTNAGMVFSARDAYVWPSSDYPGDGELVGTYTFFGHHPNGEFEYIICKDTFPAGQRNQWVKLIKSAIGQWATSTDQFITMIPRIDGEDGWRCADRTGPIGQFIMDDDERNEVRMLDGGQGLTKVLAFPEVNSDVFKLCIAGAPACVTSFSGYSGIGANDTLRTQYAQAHDDCENGDPDGCANLVDLQWSILLAAFSSNREAENEIESVDLIFNQGSFANPGGLPIGTPASTQFNTCLSNVNPAVAAPDHDYEAYRIAVHEAGHALGLSNFSYAGLVTEPLWTFFEEVQPYEAAHPTIPDAVMNYDDDVPDDWATWAPSPLNEPDCSPHPFDVMAIYALYQADP